MTDRARLISVLERLLPLLETRAGNLGDSPFVSAQQPFGEVSTQLWHLRRGRLRRAWSLAMLFGENGPLARLAEQNGWADEYQPMQAEACKAIASLGRIRYFGSEEVVALGDHVALRVFFRKTSGRVTYLPGVSRPRSEIDFGGLLRIGVQEQSGAFVAIHVDPETLEVKKGLRFVRRDAVAIPSCPSDEELSRDA